MSISMAAGYSEQTEGAFLCIEAAKDWALDCVSCLPRIDRHVFIDYGAADGGTAKEFWNIVLSKTKISFPKSEFNACTSKISLCIFVVTVPGVSVIELAYVTFATSVT